MQTTARLSLPRRLVSRLLSDEGRTRRAYLNSLTAAIDYAARIITNFVITPLSFLSGTFYSIEVLPPAFHAISQINPFFYLIDGARFGMIGVSDSSPWIGLPVCLACTALVLAVCWAMLRSGYRLKA